MVIGVPKEIKEDEFRVGITPQGVKTLIQDGHKILVEKGAGVGSGFSDMDYRDAGGEMFDDPADIFKQAEMVVKVKEPVPEEFDMLREGLILFTFLHLAPNPGLTETLIKKRITAIGYETVETENGELPILTPMSEVAGKISVQIGSCLLHKNNKGRGILLGGVPGVEHGRVTIIGGGIAGFNATKVAHALGAHVTVLDIDIKRLEFIEDIFAGEVQTFISNPGNIEEEVVRSDLVIGAVLIKGAKAPVVITRDIIKSMKEGSVIVDISIDQGGCVETSRATTHSHPTFEVDGVIHYCVSNIPGIVPRTSTIALTNLTLPYIRRLASKDLKKTLLTNRELAKGVNTCNGMITHKALADSTGYPHTPIEDILNR